MTTQQKLDSINNAIMLINKAVADNTFNEICMPNMPKVTLKALEHIKRDIEKNSECDCRQYKNLGHCDCR